MEASLIVAMIAVISLVLTAFAVGLAIGLALSGRSGEPSSRSSDQ
ncbi:MAG TPA: hypothetical protein VF533_16070 [Solirubrobacteraceae bacterium]|jgi:hypothetical protein